MLAHRAVAKIIEVRTVQLWGRPSERLQLILIAISAAIEVGTGVVLIVQPSALVWLLLGAELSEAGQALGRVAGFALLALGWACWPTKKPAQDRTAAPSALLIYNSLTTLYLAYLGIGEGLVGKLLWPVVAVHAVLSVMLAHSHFGQRAKTKLPGT